MVSARHSLLLPTSTFVFRQNTMGCAFHTSPFFFFFFFIVAQYSFVTFKVLGFNSGRNSTRIAMKLIRRDSITGSSYLNTKARATPEDHIEYLRNISSARFMYLRETIERELGSSDFQVDARRTIHTPMFFVNFSIGQPPVPQFSIMDTGSSLLWIQCLPCKHCSNQTSPLLNPSMSSTFNLCSCKNPFCRYAPNAYCGTSNECLYEQTYVNGAGSKGVLAKERLTFKTPADVITRDIVFGCGHDNGEHTDEQFTGILGLGAKRTSLAVQLGSKFSYCIGDVTDMDYDFNQLVLGEEANLLGSPTPVDTNSGVYYMNLEGISVGERQLNIDPWVFRRIRPKTGVMLDTGTLFTWLAESAYRELYNEIKSILDTNLERYWYKDYLCYNGRVKEDLTGFPVVTFHFAGEADLVLDATGMFYQMSESDVYWDVFCMAVRPTTEHGIQYKDFTAIGLLAQQYHNIAYDLREQKVYFQRIDCVVLDDYSPS